MSAALRSPHSRSTLHATCGLLIAALVGLSTPVAVAQETREYDLPDLEGEVAEETLPEKPTLGDLLDVRFKASNRFVGMADFGRYRANSYQPEGRVRLTMPVSENAGVRLMGTGRVLHYDFDERDADLGIGRRSDGPFDDLYAWTVRLQGAYVLDEDLTLFTRSERWSLLLDSYVKSKWEKGTPVADGITGGGSLAVGYRLGRTLELAAGVSVGSRLDKSTPGISPIIEFDWRINEQWKLSSQGIGLQLERRFGERFTVFGRARWEGDTFRLGPRPGLGRPDLKIRQLPVGVGAWWNLGRHLRLTTLAGVMAIHKLRLEDDEGQTIDTDTATPSPYFLVRFDFRS